MPVGLRDGQRSGATLSVAAANTSPSTTADSIVEIPRALLANLRIAEQLARNPHLAALILEADAVQLIHRELQRLRGVWRERRERRDEELVAREAVTGRTGREQH